MNASQVKAKARMAVKRREEEVEQEETESGELNLVPYLDIVTNVMLFMLASVSTSSFLGHIDTNLPNQAPATPGAVANPNKSPDQQSVGLALAVTADNILLFSLTGLEGTKEAPKAVIRRLVSPANNPAPIYDYKALNDQLFEIANRRYKGKIRSLETYEIIFMVDNDIPYETVIATLDAMRQRKPNVLEGTPNAAMPRMEEQGEGAAKKMVPVELYDPEKHFLFNDPLFSNGFQ